MTDAAQLQAAYYAATASRYDAMHLGHPEHHRALEVLAAAVPALGLRSVLDVGTGTGRALRFLADRRPELELRGIDPVPELLERAEHEHGLPREWLDVGSGTALPYEDGSFDCVIACGVLHHVAERAQLLAEMRRVARRAVVVSDVNRFGHGRVPARAIKLALAKARLWPLADRLNTRGKGYRVSEDDGVSYSYSLYDDLDGFAGWASDVQLLGLDGVAPRSWLHPLLTSAHVLLFALRATTPR